MTFQCIGCHDKFRSEDTLLKHIIKSKCDDVFLTGFSKKNIFICSKDRFGYKIGYKNILYTLQKHYRFNNMEEYKLIEKMMRLYIEDTNLSKIQEKVIKDIEGKKQCLYCFKTFSTDSNLLKHIRNVCVQEKEYVTTEDNSFTLDIIRKKMDIIREVLNDLGYESRIENVFEDKRMSVLKNREF